MLPGKKYQPEDVLQILRRRFWFVLVPFALASALTAVVARSLPDRYRSDTLILVVPQRVPEAYVKSTVTTRIEDRLQSISQQILSRTRLERVIQDFDLYKEERQTRIMEDIVEKMRGDIKVDVVKGDAFRVSYSGSEPRTVMRVTERLASHFIEENLRDREVLAEGTNQFLESQLEDARQRLMEHEKKLEAYRRQYSGQLPSQLESNMQVIQNTQLQIQSVVESMNKDRDRRLAVDRQLADLEAGSSAALATPAAPAPNTEGAVTVGTDAQQLEAARATLQALEARLKEGHPDLRLWQRRVRDLEKKVQDEAGKPVSAASTSPAAAARLRRIADLKAELEQLDRQIAHKQEEEKRLRGMAATYQARVDMVPTRESEMAELTRDYATLQTMYTNLLAKKEESKIAANMERRQAGEQFKLLDPARLPEKPYSPDRRLINMIGVIIGLGIGLGIIALLEYRDTSFHTDDEMAALLSLPVLAVVPSMHSDEERRSRRRRRIALHLGLASTVTASLAVVVYTLLR